MKMWKRIGLVAATGFLVVVAAEIGDRMEIPGVQSTMPDAEARVGRPLTPVSYAGVARRTVRRCAVGVYRC
ncbi:MAG TPA: hypothetical protein VJ984_13575 [Xanthomonadales bacterium]|nr:hypothetical protein [Xanthomonadales bacterium]